MGWTLNPYLPHRSHPPNAGMAAANTIQRCQKLRFCPNIRILSLKIASLAYTNEAYYDFSAVYSHKANTFVSILFINLRISCQTRCWQLWWSNYKDGWRRSHSARTSILLNSWNRYDSYRTSPFTRASVASLAWGTIGTLCLPLVQNAFPLPQCLCTWPYCCAHGSTILANPEHLQSASFMPSRLGHGL